MRIERDPRGGGPAVQGFGAAGFRIDGAVYPAVLLTATAVTLWEPPALEALDVAAIGDLLADRPEFVLLGTGATLRAAPGLMRALDALGFGLEVMDSRAAARAWGVLRGEGRRVAAALYPLAR